MSKPTRVVLDGNSRGDAELLARAQWDQGCVTGLPFDALSAGVQHGAIEQAQRLLLDLAGRPGAVTLPDEVGERSRAA